MAVTALHINLASGLLACTVPLIWRHDLDDAQCEWRTEDIEISSSFSLSLWSMLTDDVIHYLSFPLGLFFSSLPENKETFFWDIEDIEDIEDILERCFVDVYFLFLSQERFSPSHLSLVSNHTFQHVEFFLFSYAAVSSMSRNVKKGTSPSLYCRLCRSMTATHQCFWDILSNGGPVTKKWTACVSYITWWESIVDTWEA